MKSRTLHSSTRMLLIAAFAAGIPISGAMAQSYNDDTRSSDNPASVPSTSDEGTTSVNPPEFTMPSQPESGQSYQQQTTQPRGARGPIREDRRQSSRWANDRNQSPGLADYDRTFPSD